MNVSATSPLIWIQKGKTQHLAYIIEGEGPKVLVQWESTGHLEWVSKNDVLENLPTRRNHSLQGERHKPVVRTLSNDIETSGHASNTKLMNQSGQSDDDDDDNDVEILLTIHPSSNMWGKEFNNMKSQECVDNAKAEELNEIIDLSNDASSVDTHEDILLTDLMTSPNKMSFPNQGHNCIETSPTTLARESNDAGFHHKSHEEKMGDWQDMARQDEEGKSTCGESLDTKNGLGKEDEQMNFVADNNGFERSDINTDSSSLNYSFNSSAYVQNLAEICYTILNDHRWRVGNELKQLFQWENGDDVKAIVALSKAYEPILRSDEKVCNCLLSQKQSKLHINHFPLVLDTSATIRSGNNDSEFRPLNLYCRLFYRKGPWFRVDDIFTKYYSSKGYNNRVYFEHAITEKQFVSNSYCEETYRQGISKAVLMILDLNRLCELGLLRKFRHEEECGKVIGSVGSEGCGTLLNAEERRSMLDKLGGSKRKSTKSKVSQNAIPPKGNEILKQMSQQKSILGFFSPKKITAESQVLPVRRHVNQNILEKLSAAIILSVGSREYISHPNFRAKVLEIKDILCKIIQQKYPQILDVATIDTCFRLVEEPLRTLRRCCRLYLCANCGPGDMRGDGTNGWKSIRDSLETVGKLSHTTRFAHTPGGDTWNSTIYPGLLARFNLRYFDFVDAYVGLPVSDPIICDDLKMIQVFPSYSSFQLWETAAELRAYVDYWIEINELYLYDERRTLREESGKVNTKSNHEHWILRDTKHGVDIDFLNLYDESSRADLVRKFILVCRIDPAVEKECLQAVLCNIENSIQDVFNEFGKNDEKNSVFRTDCERLIFIIAVIFTNILNFSYSCMGSEDKAIKSRRCWLRHLWWEGVISYILWDCIPIIEKRGLYSHASRALEVLVFGSYQSECWRRDSIEGLQWGRSLENEPVGDIMISRRARGKAIERLMIDYTHILRGDLKNQDSSHLFKQDKNGAKRKGKKSLKGKMPIPSINEKVNALCRSILDVMSKSAMISFTSIRALAKRLKTPLEKILIYEEVREAKELGMRLRNPSSSISNDYDDWKPKTDQAVAVALSGEENTPGSRCSFIGFEDKVNGAADASSLNVEQLAMEFYFSGRLPSSECGESSLEGGHWEGWHDEGGHLRTLFRIFCSCSLLGMDGGCALNDPAYHHCDEKYTIHLTRYQGAPFDLHVGSWSHNSKGGDVKSISGFYSRRKARIEEVLSKLETMSPQELCSCVYDSIEARLMSTEATKNYNTVLHRDMQQLRTLSMLAAGFGGKLLAAAFRCMVFDYRHFSGGLPDLLLARAYFSDISTGKEFVDLGDWIGESFSPEAKIEREMNKGFQILSDRDEEFLGCSKVGDSGTSRGKNRSNMQANRNGEKVKLSLPDLPGKLFLIHNDRPVSVQCMFVEVKSQNDRLDGRQEDWLNVLDRFGNARVCKFVANKQRHKRQKVASHKSAGTNL
jgi:hypothetical protein